MSKILLFADIHLHPHKKSSDRLHDCLRTLDWVFKTAVDRKIKNVIFLGDLFHDRQKIDVLTYQRSFEIFEKYLGEDPDFYFYSLLGNHDLWHWQKGDISSVNPFRALPGITVIDKPSTLTLCDGDKFFPISFLPYTHDPIADLKKVEESWKGFLGTNKFPWEEDYRILCGHVAVDGAVWNVMHQTHAEVAVEHDGDMVKVNPGIFNDWTRVFLGHYHCAQKLSHNVEYIGSPLQLSFGEAFQDKRILIYDVETRQHEYVINTSAPQHFIIPESDIDKYDLKSNFIRIVVDDLSAGRSVEIRKTMADAGVGSVEIKQAPKEEAHTIENAKLILGDTEQMRVKYVEEVLKNSDINLEKDKLLDVGKKICQTKKEDLDEI